MDEPTARAALLAKRAETWERLRGLDDSFTDIDHALTRLDAGTYTTCTRCGGQIEDARLEARPATTLCIACAHAAPR